MTPEEMTAKILELTEQNKTLAATVETMKAAQETAKKDNEGKDKRINDLLEFNQKLFLQITGEPKPDDKKEPEVISCEDFAKQIIEGKVK